MLKKIIYSRKNTFFLKIAVACTILGVSLSAFLFFTRGPKKNDEYKGVRKISVKYLNNRYNFYKNGKPFIVKGGSGFTHLKELVECGGNTIVCWDTSKLVETLEKAAKFNLEVIVGLDLPTANNEFYKDERKVKATFDAYRKIVFKYKDHQSLLAWCLGNEIAIPFSLSAPFYKAYYDLLDMIHNSDPNHPVSASIYNVGKKEIIKLQWRIPALDFICINIYNSIKTMSRDLGLMKLIWSGPYLLLEWGSGGGWEAELTAWGAPIEQTSTKKAEQYYDRYLNYMPRNDKRFLGSLAFYWGSRQEYTYTWFSIFNEDGFPTEVKETLYDCWNDTVTKHLAPNLKYMLVDDLGAGDNIILSPGSTHKASILLTTMQPSDSLQFSWQILKEDWLNWKSNYFNFKRPPNENSLFTDSTLQNTSFMAPLKEGPYRIFVTVYNSKGYCATANTPIYVIK
jgi:hypothetical protein